MQDNVNFPYFPKSQKWKYFPIALAIFPSTKNVVQQGVSVNLSKLGTIITILCTCHSTSYHP